MIPFLCTIFSKFHDLKDLWQAALSVLTELDCLSSLAILSGQQEGVMCRPNFIDYSGVYEKNSVLDLK